MDLKFLGFLLIFSAIIDLVVYSGTKKKNNDKNFAELTVGCVNLAEGLVFYELSELMLEMENSFSDEETTIFIIMRLGGIIMIGLGVLIIVQKIYTRLSVWNTSIQVSSRVSNTNSNHTTNGGFVPTSANTSNVNKSSNGRWECSQCHSKNPPVAQACTRCGAVRAVEERKSEGVVVCPECGDVHKKGTCFCVGCGTKLED